MSESDKLKPIPTVYKGYRFRSRLEARWAVFFDVCGAKWEYEPEGFDLGNGIYYLPDFVVYEVDSIHGWPFGSDGCIDKLYVEVKGDLNLSEIDKMKLKNFPEPLLLLGPIPDGQCVSELWDSIYKVCYDSPYPYNFESVDGDHYGCLPASTGHGLYLEGPNYFYNGDEKEQATVAAYNAARSARFEHGEVPHVYIEPKEAEIKMPSEKSKLALDDALCQMSELVKKVDISELVSRVLLKLTTSSEKNTKDIES